MTAHLPGDPERRPAPAGPSTIPASDRLLALLREQVAGVTGLRLFTSAVAEGTSESIAPILMLNVAKPGDRSGRDYARALLALESLAGLRLMLLYDETIDLEDSSLVLWKLFNNTDPGRDLHFQDSRCVVDACRKDASDGHLREWPDELAFDP